MRVYSRFIYDLSIMIGCFTVLLGYALSIAGCKAIATYMDIQPGFVYTLFWGVAHS